MSDHFPGRAEVAFDFRLARRRAALQAVVSRLTGASTELLSYEEVRQKLRARETSARGLEVIPLNQIVGSVGRYKEFTRDFLPRKNINADRWIRVKMAMTGLRGVPPIEVYRIGEVYFVLDGNHRVSVAREMGLTHLEAYVTTVESPVVLTRDAQPDDLILKAEYVDFLERTHQKELRPEAKLRLTAAGRYPILIEHIDVHRYYLGLDHSREIPYAEAFTSWYDIVYAPVAQVILQRGLLREFPERTEADLYLWISQHRSELEESLGWQISSDRAALDLRPQKAATRADRPAKQRLLQILETEPGTAGLPGSAEEHAPKPTERHGQVIDDLLVAIDGQDSGWTVLDQAIEVARREGAHVLGLHVVPVDGDRSDKRLEDLEAQFGERCRSAGVDGRLAIEAGRTAQAICERARWADLVVTGLVPSATENLRSRLGSEFRTLMRHCPRPVLVVPGPAVSPQRALLAYDGSPKSEEALYVACYLAGWWSLSLVIVTLNESTWKTSKIQGPARAYLKDHGIEADFGLSHGPAGPTILQEADAHACDIILMGGYGSSAPVEAVLGSTVDEVLRTSSRPVLVLT